jgi:HAMP domain-containing protein
MSGLEAATFGVLVLIALVVIGALFFAFLTSERP